MGFTAAILLLRTYAWTSCLQDNKQGEYVTVAPLPARVMSDRGLPARLDPQPPCRLVHPSQRKCWIALSTICKTQPTRSRVVASFQSHGFHAPENISFPTSNSTTKAVYSHGKPYSQTLPPLPHIMQKPCALTVSRSSHARMQRKAVGFQLFLAS